METQIHENEDKMVQPEFWNDPEEAQKVIDSNNHLKKIVDGFNDLKDSIDDIEVSLELLKEEDDEDMQEMIDENVKETEEKFDEYELNIFFNDEHDYMDAVLEVHSVAGVAECNAWDDIWLR